MRKILLMAAASVVSALCWGQMPDTSPAPEMMKFDWLVGEWESTSTWAMPDVPEMSVETTMKVEWDGQFLRHTSVYVYAGFMNFTETLMLGYDPTTERYSSSAFTNMAPTPRIEHGRLVGSTLVMLSEPWLINGEESVSRATVVKTSDDAFRFILEFKDGDDWDVISDGTFRRKK